jgi:uncharacterized membrane protein YozB (DUF420 family)
MARACGTTGTKREASLRYAGGRAGADPASIERKVPPTAMPRPSFRHTRLIFRLGAKIIVGTPVTSVTIAGRCIFPACERGRLPIGENLSLVDSASLKSIANRRLVAEIITVRRLDRATTRTVLGTAPFAATPFRLSFLARVGNPSSQAYKASAGGDVGYLVFGHGHAAVRAS